jgi:hypothetical protein
MKALGRYFADDRPGWEASLAGDRIAFQILVFLATTLSLAHVAYLFGIGLSGIIPVTAFVLACLTGFALPGMPGPSHGLSRLAAIAIFPTVLILSIAVATFFYDVSFDGQLYHQDAILRLVRGWNPLLETGPSWYRKVSEHYPKAGWIIAASLQCVTGNIETGKALNILLVVASFFVARRALAATGIMPARGRTLVALLLALNPVSIYQLFSFMSDGCLASLLVILVGQMIILVRDPSRRGAVQLGIAAILLANVKYTGLVYLLVLGVPWLLFFLWKRRDLAKRVLLSAGVIVFLALFLFGFNPYVVNTVHHGDPLYPMLSDEGRDFQAGQVSDEYYRKGRIEKFALSLFAQSRNSIKDPPVLKVPFSVRSGEALAFTTWDTRFAGWGPLFSGAIVIALVMMAFLWRRRPDAFRIGMIVAVWLLFSVLVFPEPWWARFVPQVWFLPVVALVLAWPVPDRPLVFLRKALAATMVLNVAFVSFVYLGAETWSSLYLREHLAILSEMSANEPLAAKFQLYPSNGERLRAAGVRFQAVRTLPCDRPVFFDRVGRERSSTATLICVDRDDYARLEASRLAVLRDGRNRFVSYIAPGGKATDGTPLIQEARR